MCVEGGESYYVEGAGAGAHLACHIISWKRGKRNNNTRRWGCNKMNMSSESDCIYASIGRDQREAGLHVHSRSLSEDALGLADSHSPLYSESL